MYGRDQMNDMVDLSVLTFIVLVDREYHVVQW